MLRKEKIVALLHLAAADGKVENKTGSPLTRLPG